MSCRSGNNLGGGQVAPVLLSHHVLSPSPIPLSAALRRSPPLPSSLILAPLCSPPGQVAVSWHADSSLEHFSSIAVLNLHIPPAPAPAAGKTSPLPCAPTEHSAEQANACACGAAAAASGTESAPPLPQPPDASAPRRATDDPSPVRLQRTVHAATMDCPRE